MGTSWCSWASFGMAHMDTHAAGLPETVAEVCALPSLARHHGALPGRPRATRTRMGTLSGEGVAGVPLTICQGRDSSCGSVILVPLGLHRPCMGDGTGGTWPLTAQGRPVTAASLSSRLMILMGGMGGQVESSGEGAVPSRLTEMHLHETNSPLGFAQDGKRQRVLS